MFSPADVFLSGYEPPHLRFAIDVLRFASQGGCKDPQVPLCKSVSPNGRVFAGSERLLVED